MADFLLSSSVTVLPLRGICLAWAQILLSCPHVVRTQRLPHTCTYSNACTHTQVYIHAFAICVYTHMHASTTHMHVHKYAHMHMYTCTHISTHTVTEMLSHTILCWFLVPSHYWRDHQFNSSAGLYKRDPVLVPTYQVPKPEAMLCPVRVVFSVSPEKGFGSPCFPRSLTSDGH